MMPAFTRRRTIFVVFKVEPWKGARHWAGVAAVEQLARAGQRVHLFARPEWLGNPIFDYLHALGVEVHLPDARLINVSRPSRYIVKAFRVLVGAARNGWSVARSRRALASDDGRVLEYWWLRHTLERARRLEMPDLLHAFGATQWTASAVRWAVARGVPAFYTETQQPGDEHYTAVLKTFVHQCTAVIVHGESLIDAFRAIGCRSPLKVIPFGILGPESIPAPRPDEEPVTIGCASRYETQKGLHILIDAVAELRKRCQSVRLLLAGEGPAREALVSKVRELGLGQSVEIRGPYLLEDGLDGFMSEIDVYCLPSFQEGQPVSIIEAMAYGRPVVATDVGSVAELVGDDAGLVVKPNMAHELAAALARLVEDRSLRRVMGERARARYLARHQIAEVMRAHLAFYDVVRAALALQ